MWPAAATFGSVQDEHVGLPKTGIHNRVCHLVSHGTGYVLLVTIKTRLPSGLVWIDLGALRALVPQRPHSTGGRMYCYVPPPTLLFD